MKVMVIGWDAGSHRFLSERLDELGFLSSLTRRVGHLYPTEGYIGAYVDSAMAWMTLMSGLPPEVHRILSVHTIRMAMRDKLAAGSSRPSKKYEKNPLPRWVKIKRIWDYLSERGYSCGVVNVPLTFPPTPLNGFMVSGLFAHPSYYTYPEGLWRKLKEMGYRPDIPPKMGVEVHWHDYREMLGSARAERDDIRDVMERRFKCAKWLLKNYETDFFVIVFMALDSIQHRFYGDEKVTRKFYSRMDEMSEELVDIADPQNLIVLSDHGMKRATRFGPVMSLDSDFKLFLIKQALKYVSSGDVDGLVRMAKTFQGKHVRGHHDSTDGFCVIKGWDNSRDLRHTDIVPIIKKMMVDSS